MFNDVTKSRLAERQCCQSRMSPFIDPTAARLRHVHTKCNWPQLAVRGPLASNLCHDDVIDRKTPAVTIQVLGEAVLCVVAPDVRDLQMTYAGEREQGELHAVDSGDGKYSALSPAQLERIRPVAQSSQ